MDLIRAGCGAHLTLADVASRLGLSSSRLEHLFTAETGGTFRAALREARLARARYLLRDPSLRIKEVAGKCGGGNMAISYCDQQVPSASGCTFCTLCGYPCCGNWVCSACSGGCSEAFLFDPRTGRFVLGKECALREREVRPPHVGAKVVSSHSSPEGRKRRQAAGRCTTVSTQTSGTSGRQG